MTLMQGMKAFIVRHRKALSIATALYVVVIAALIVLSMGPQTEPFVYQVR